MIDKKYSKYLPENNGILYACMLADNRSLREGLPLEYVKNSLSRGLANELMKKVDLVCRRDVDSFWQSFYWEDASPILIVESLVLFAWITFPPPYILRF